MTVKYPIYILGLLLVSNLVVGQQAYKSIDKFGNVTYSSTPPQDAVEAEPVDIAPRPSAEQVNAAEQRAEDIKQEARAIESSRKPTQPSKADSSGVPEAVTTSETSGDTYYDYGRRPNPLTRVPIESSSGGDHKIYSPNKGQARPISGTRPAAR